MHVGKLSLFFLLSLADFTLTWWLLRGEDPPAYEANPLAAWCLGRFGWAGLAVFKAATVLTAAAAAAAVCCYRPRVGGRVLAAACLVAGVTVFYSAGLCWASHEQAAEHARLEAEAMQVEEEVSRSRAYRGVLDRLSKDLLAGRRTLAEGVAELSRSDRADDPQWMTLLRGRFGCTSDAGCLACNLSEYTQASLRHLPPAARHCAGQWLRHELQRFLDERGDSAARLPVRPWHGPEASAGRTTPAA